MVAPIALGLGAGRFAMQALPYIGGLVGALPGIRQGDLGQAVIGGGLGAATGGGLRGPITGLAQGAGARLGARGLPGLAQAAATGIPFLGAAGTIPLASAGASIGGGAAGNLAQAGAGQLGYKTPSGEFVPLGDPAAVGQFGGVPPLGGSPLGVINPAGRDAARRLTQRKDAETLRDNINLVLPTVEKFADRSKQRDLQRNLAAAGVRANIEGNVEQLLAAQQAVNQMGLNAQQGAVNALQTQYNYR